MIEYAFLATGVVATGACAYYATQGSGVHRLVATRRQLRAECGRLERQGDELTSALVKVIGERDAAIRTAWTYCNAAKQAARTINELTEQLGDAKKLREENASLKAALANATAVSQKATAGTEAPKPRRIPVVYGAPYASTGPVPSQA